MTDFISPVQDTEPGQMESGIIWMNNGLLYGIINLFRY